MRHPTPSSPLYFTFHGWMTNTTITTTTMMMMTTPPQIHCNTTTPTSLLDHHWLKPPTSPIAFKGLLNPASHNHPHIFSEFYFWGF